MQKGRIVLIEVNYNETFPDALSEVGDSFDGIVNIEPEIITNGKRLEGREMAFTGWISNSPDLLETLRVPTTVRPCARLHKTVPISDFAEVVVEACVSDMANRCAMVAYAGEIEVEGRQEQGPIDTPDAEDALPGPYSSEAD